MKVRIMQLCDIHTKADTKESVLNATRIINALSSLEPADKYIIAMSVDIAFSGKHDEYNKVYEFIHDIFSNKSLSRTEQYIECLCVPGNHDVDFFGCNLAKNADEFKEKYNGGIRSTSLDIDKIVNDYSLAMRDFFNFSKGIHCDWFNNKDIIKKTVDCGGYRIGFVLVNSATLSLLGGDGSDKGCHFLSESQLAEIASATEANINCLIMHHGIEWFNDDTKKRLRNILADRYVIVLVGHEHDGIAENRIINDGEPCFYMQTNAFNDDNSNHNGFSVLDIDTQSKELVAMSFLLSNDIYLHNKVGSASLHKYSVKGVRNTSDFLKKLKEDHNGTAYEDYFFFPRIEYTNFDDNSIANRHEFKTESSLVDFIIGKDRVSIYGSQKGGKTLLIKRLYLQLLDRGIVPLLFDTNIHDVRNTRIIEAAFNNQYRTENNAFERFSQLPKEKRIAIVDDADLIKPRSITPMMELLEEKFCTIILTHKTEVATNIHEQILDAIDENYKLVINPYWYTERKGLIKNVLSSRNIPKENLRTKVNEINEFINNQIKYFDLTPEFIIDFVNLYEQDDKYLNTTGRNAFGMVYENTIKNRIIANCGNESPEKIFNILQEIAYYMHFDKKGKVSTIELINCIEKYEANYRQEVNHNDFITVAKNSGILTEKNNEYSFNDRTQLAYFVARAINLKASDPSESEYDEAERNFLGVLDNLCFGINSDIVLFLSIVTNSTRFINLIIERGKTFFKEFDEFSFKKNNVSFILNTSIQIQDKLPGEEEKSKRDERISETERQIKVSDIIETVNEYDYSDDDLELHVNKIQKALKYLEVMSKILPAFCASMRRNKQDELVDLIYRAPNKLLYMILKDIDDKFDDFVEELYKEASKVQRDGKTISKNSVKKFTEQISAFLVISIYERVSATAASKDSLGALNDFSDILDDTNYEILNLMFNARVRNVKYLAKNAIPLDKKLRLPLEKAIVKITVRNFFLRNEVKLHGDGHSLIDHFFGNKGRNMIQVERGKKELESFK